MFKCSDEELIEKLRKAKTRNDIASLLEIDEKTLRYILYVKRPENMYVTFSLPKKKSGFREINAPTGSLKTIQKKLAYILNLIYKDKPCVYGFLKSKNIKKNAKQHCKKNYIFNLDLKDFFSSIHFGRVRGMLLKPPYNISNNAATVIAQLACKNGLLPQGAPSSPVITNMIFRPLDTQLINLAKKYSITYTRYADDISFSSRKSFPKEIVYFNTNNELCVGLKLNEIISANSFTINSNKVFLNYKNSRQEVTGLIVNKFPNLKREYIRNLRAILHNCSKNGIYETAKKYAEYSSYINKSILLHLNSNDPNSQDKIYNWFKNVICGKIRFISTIRGKSNPYFIKYATQCNTLFKENIFDIGSIKQLQHSTFVIQSHDERNQGTGFFLKDIGLITSYHVTPSKEGFYKIFNELSYPTSLTLTQNNRSKYCNKELDYAIYEVKNPLNTYLELGNSSDLKTTDNITIAGYPSYMRGDTLYIENGSITNIKGLFHGSKLYTVSSRLIHGSSGGPVIDSKNRVVGIIKAGTEDMDNENNSIQGFLPIDLILKDIESQKKTRSFCNIVIIIIIYLFVHAHFLICTLYFSLIINHDHP